MDREHGGPEKGMHRKAGLRVETFEEPAEVGWRMPEREMVPTTLLLSLGRVRQEFGAD